MGTETYAMLAGTIDMVGRDKSRGNYVMIRHDDYIVTYCHLAKVVVNQGQIVEPGETVGLVGSTGRSTGPHLHLTLRRGKQLLNPQILLDCIRRILEKEYGRSNVSVYACRGSLTIPLGTGRIPKTAWSALHHQA